MNTISLFIEDSEKALLAGDFEEAFVQLESAWTATAIGFTDPRYANDKHRYEGEVLENPFWKSEGLTNLRALTFDEEQSYFTWTAPDVKDYTDLAYLVWRLTDLLIIRKVMTQSSFMKEVTHHSQELKKLLVGITNEDLQVKLPPVTEEIEPPITDISSPFESIVRTENKNPWLYITRDIFGKVPNQPTNKVIVTSSVFSGKA